MFVEYERDPRLYGETGYTFKKMLNFAIDGITAFSQFPIRLVTYIGLSMGAFSLVGLFYALYSKFIIGETVKGWTSIFILFTLIGGTQLFCLGIIGEYISRIMNNVLHRPDYLVDETNIED
jgi:dolichol-phosphate mannosyltransferase